MQTDPDNDEYLELEVAVLRKKGSLPKETIKVDRKDRSDYFKSAMNEIVLEHSKMKERDDSSLPRNSIKNLIVHDAIKHDVLEASVNDKTIYSRFKCKSIF